jgi:hypothetical protein
VALRVLALDRPLRDVIASTLRLYEFSEAEGAESLNVLLEAWANKHVVDIAYHLGEAYLKKNNGAEADKYLTTAQTLFNEALANKEVVDSTLQPSIIDAQERATKLKGKKGS